MTKDTAKDSNPQALLTCSKKIWTGDEDIKLKSLIDEHGTCSWTKVGESFLERTGKQCRERWYNHLDPSVKKGEWTAEVNYVLLDVAYPIIPIGDKQYGSQKYKFPFTGGYDTFDNAEDNRKSVGEGTLCNTLSGRQVMDSKLSPQQFPPNSQITKALPGRTDNAIKNRFHATCRAQSRKEPGDYEKSSYNYNDGNTDSDSNSAEGDSNGRVPTDLASNGPTIAMMQAHCPIMAYPSPDSFQNSSIFSFSNPVPYIFDNASPSADPSQSFRSAMPAHSGSLLKSSKTVKCAKKSKKVTSLCRQQQPQDTMSASELHSARVSGLHSAVWAHPVNSTQDLLADMNQNIFSAQHQSRLCNPYPPHGTTIISPATSKTSTTCPSPIQNPSLAPSSLTRGHLGLSIVSDLPCAPTMYNRAAFNGLSLRERLAPAPMLPSSPTFSDDFKMNMPSTSSIDLDENLFDDWMDDDTVMGDTDYSTSDSDVPFYRASFDWGLNGCFNMGGLAPSGCFSSGQSNSAQQEADTTLCGLQRLSYGQTQPSATPSTGSGFFSLGGRICGAQKFDQSFEQGYQGQAQSYAPTMKIEHAKQDFSKESFIPAHHLLQSQYSR